MLDVCELPENTFSDAIFAQYNDGSKEYRMDVIWYPLNQIESPIEKDFSYKLLFRVASILWMIPHSNACILKNFFHGQ